MAPISREMVERALGGAGIESDIKIETGVGLAGGKRVVTGRRISRGGARTKKESDRIAAEAAAAARFKAAQDSKDRQTERDRERDRQQAIKSGMIAGQLEAEEAPGFRIGLSERERRLSRGQVIRGRFGEVGSGLVSAGALLAEGAVSLASLFGQQTIEFTEEGQRVDKSFRFSEEGFIGKQKAKPSGTGKVLGQALVFAPLVGGAITGFASGVASQGLKTTVVETVTAFNPLQIRPQTFGALTGKGAVDDLKFDVASFKTTTGQVTKRTVVGRAKDFDDVFILSKQVSTKVGGKDVSIAVTDITAPTTSFRLGKFTEGLQSIRSDSLGFGSVSGKVAKGVKVNGLSFSQSLEGLGGAGGKVATRTRASLFFDESGRFIADVNLGALQFGTPRTIGSISKPSGDIVTRFASGKGQRQFSFDKEFGLRQKVRVDDFNIRGVEFDVAKLGARDQFGIGVSSGGKGGKGLDSGLELVSKQISASISDIAPVVSARNGASAVSVSARTVISQVGGVFGLPSVFAGTGQFETTTGGQSLISSSTQKDLLKVVGVPLVDLGVDISSQLDIGQRARVGFRGRTKQDFAVRPALDFKPALDLVVGTDVIQELIPKQQPKIKQKEEFFDPQPSPFFGFAGGFSPKLIPGFGFGGLFGTLPSTTKKQKSRRPRERISPSLTGLVVFDLGGITGDPLKLSGVGGRSPFDIRLVPTRRKVKKKKK